MCGIKSLIGRFTTPLGVHPLREDIALRALGGDELLVQPRRDQGKLRGRVTLGSLPRVDDARETRQHEQTARRDHRTGTQRRRRRERCGVVRRDEDRDRLSDTPATLRYGSILRGTAACDRDVSRVQ